MLVYGERVYVSAINQIHTLGADAYAQTKFADTLKRAVEEEIRRSGAAPINCTNDMDFNRVVENIARECVKGER